MEYVDERRDAIERRLAEVVARVDPEELAGEMEHVVLAGGKRLRPTLTLLVCEATRGPEDAGVADGGTHGYTERALDFAAGVELVHNASLVVDDIIDRSAVRRGGPSAWATYGHGPALVASDGLLGAAFDLFSADPRAMAAAADAVAELGEGEATELVDVPETEAEYMALARRKTGALFRAAAQLGAIAADADASTVETFGEYAERLGIAFQIRDDVLDATADETRLGKPAGQDAAMDRPSILQVTEKTPGEVDRIARAQAEGATAALDSLSLADGQARTYLEGLATFAVERER
ncbi:MAG: polyprenyl synthetase family protein [Halobacteriaceae archaeon]